MLEKKEVVLFIIVLLLISVGCFVEYEVKKIIKSTDEISKSIYKLDEHLSPELEELDDKGIKVMLKGL